MDILLQFLWLGYDFNGHDAERRRGLRQPANLKRE
jgi:hypothetical protein